MVIESSCRLGGKTEAVKGAFPHSECGKAPFTTSNRVGESALSWPGGVLLLVL
jgi:hypothetical protein